MILLSAMGYYTADNFNLLFKACKKYKATIRSVTSHFENDYFMTYAVIEMGWAYVDKLEKAFRDSNAVTIIIHNLMNYVPGDSEERPNVFDLEFSIGNKNKFDLAALMKLVTDKNNIIYEMSFGTKFLPIAGVEIMVGSITVGIMGSLNKALTHLEDIAQLASDLDIIATYNLKTS